MHNKALVAAIGLTMAMGGSAQAASYIFAGSTNGLDLVTHPTGYTGAGGVVNVSVGIDPTSANAAAMQVSVQNVVRTWNGMVATKDNLKFGEISASSFDFESVLLHELGHSLGLSHINAASESGLTGADSNYTVAEVGVNGSLDLNPGLDGVIGSSDDIRGDDINMNWFVKATNDPFDLALPAVVDSTTVSRDLADLPSGHTFAANADRDVATLLMQGDTEAAMQQGTVNGETQRTLGADDVLGLRFAQSGLDRIAGTADDYTLNLTYSGLDAGADITIDFDNAQTGFAVSQSGGAFIGANAAAITSSSIFFNSTTNWEFNQVSNDAAEVVPLPAPILMLGAGLGGLAGLRRRKRA